MRCLSIVFVLFSCTIHQVWSYSEFTIAAACSSNSAAAGHRVAPRPDDGAYSLSLSSTNWTSSLSSPRRHNITVTLTAGVAGFKGIMMSVFDTGTNQRQGQWGYDHIWYRLNCNNQAIVHVNASVKPHFHYVPDFDVFTWMPPTTAGIGSVKIKAAIVRDFSTIYLIQSATINEIVETPSAPPPTPPDAPTALTFYAVHFTENNIRLRWTQPNSFGSFPFIGYEVQRSNDIDTPVFQTVATINGTAPDVHNPYLLQGNVPLDLCFSDYVFRMRTLTSNSTLILYSDWSSSIQGYYISTDLESLQQSVCTCS